MHGGIVAVDAGKGSIALQRCQKRRTGPKTPRPCCCWTASETRITQLAPIARTAAFFGIPRMILSSHPGQAGLSDAAYRISEGGLEYIDVFRAVDFAVALKHLRESYHVVGTALGDYSPLHALKKPPGKPFAIVMGNEEDGLSPSTIKACSQIVTIPGSGNVSKSLNVAATTAILIYASIFSG